MHGLQDVKSATEKNKTGNELEVQVGALVLRRAARQGSPEKVTFEQTPENSLFLYGTVSSKYFLLCCLILCSQQLMSGKTVKTLKSKQMTCRHNVLLQSSTEVQHQWVQGFAKVSTTTWCQDQDQKSRFSQYTASYQYFSLTKLNCASKHAGLRQRA